MAIDLLAIEPNKVSRDLSGYVTYIYGPPKVGKAQPISTIIPTPDGFRRLGDIKKGDCVFDRKGHPTKVLDIFPQGELDCYKVRLEDGRETICNDEHLWTYISSRGNFITKTAREMMDEGITKSQTKIGDRKVIQSRYFIPANQAVQYPEKELPVDPYVVGVFLGDGCCKERQLTLSSDDEFIVAEVARLIGCKNYKQKSEKNFNWKFYLPENYDGEKTRKDISTFQTKVVFESLYISFAGP